MSDLITLEVVDSDGAIREAEAAVAGDTRASFFRKAAIGGGALVGGGVLMGGLPMVASAARSKTQDIEILNYALTLEYLEAAFYNDAIKKGALSGDLLTLAKVVRTHENAHVKFLREALGSAAVKRPRFDFKNTTSDAAAFHATAIVLEDTGVKAYSGQAHRILQVPVIKAAVSLLTVEARHASAFRELRGPRGSGAPLAFDRPASMKAILRAVKATGFIKS